MTKQITIEEAGMQWMTDEDIIRLKKVLPDHPISYPMAATPNFIDYLKEKDKEKKDG